jgi:hypothetical protein
MFEIVYVVLRLPYRFEEAHSGNVGYWTFS